MNSKACDTGSGHAMGLLTVCLLLAFVVLAGCASAPPQPLLPSKSEITVEGVAKKPVVDALIDYMLANDWQIRKINDYQAVFGTPKKSIVGQDIYGSGARPLPEHWAVFNYVETGSAVKVYGTMYILLSSDATPRAVTEQADPERYWLLKRALAHVQKSVSRPDAESERKVAVVTTPKLDINKALPADDRTRYEAMRESALAACHKHPLGYRQCAVNLDRCVERYHRPKYLGRCIQDEVHYYISFSY